MVKFTEENHLYSSVDDSNTKWTSVTTVISSLKEKFLPKETATKCSVKKSSKWFGIPPKEILQAWESEGKRSTDLGTWYHKKREIELLDLWNLYSDCRELHNSDEKDKIAPLQQLEERVYTEHLVYLDSIKLAGQVDYIQVIDNKLYIRDYKTCKEIKKESYVHWETGSKKMLPPVNHLDDCSYNHYALQLSIYAFIILRHNPQLELGSLIIEHVLFEIESEDKYGYPIYKKDGEGDFIVKEIIEILVPYMKKEVLQIFKTLKK